MCNERENWSAVNVRTGTHLVTGQQRVVCSGSIFGCKSEVTTVTTLSWMGCLLFAAFYYCCVQ